MHYANSGTTSPLNFEGLVHITAKRVMVIRPQLQFTLYFLYILNTKMRLSQWYHYICCWLLHIQQYAFTEIHNILYLLYQWLTYICLWAILYYLLPHLHGASWFSFMAPLHQNDAFALFVPLLCHARSNVKHFVHRWSICHQVYRENITHFMLARELMKGENSTPWW